jgi:dihydropteroate synthase
MILRARQRVLAFPRRPLVMGIVNINDDSFCGDGTLDVSAALAQAQTMTAQGADIIDAGAESARTNRGPISVEEECARLLPFIQRWQEWSATLPPESAVPGQVWPPLLSLNTWRPEVVATVLPAGGDLLNDIGGLPDDTNARLCAQHGAALLIMHTVGAPKEKHTHLHYPDIMEEMQRFFADRLRMTAAAGLPADATVLDPGLDFAKQCPDNLRIVRDMGQLHTFQRPVLLPVSRKTFIGQTLGLKNPLDRDAGTVACIAAGMARGTAIFRIHNVPAATAAVRVLHAVGASSSSLSK